MRFALLCRKGICAGLTLAALLSSGCSPHGQGGDGKAMTQVRMAVRGQEDDPAVAQRWTAFKALIQRATGLPVTTYESSDYNGTIQAVASNQVDIATLAGGGYANADAQIGNLVAPILTSRDAEGSIGYYSAIIVKKTSPYHALADLKGKSLGYVDFNSTSGYLFPRAAMRDQGVDPDTFFGKTSFAGGHTQSVMALENGQFDAAVVMMAGGTPTTGFTTGAFWTLARKGLIKADDYRIIWTAGPIPNGVMVVRTDRPQPFIDTVRGALAAMAYDDPKTWSETGQRDGSTYAAVDRSHYAAIIKLRADDIARRRGKPS